jgi:hypothetical protein
VTLSELLDALAERGSTLTADGESLRHRGRRFADDDPLRRALATFYDEVLWLLASARLCVFCPRMLDQGEKSLCPRHRRLRDALPPTRLAGHIAAQLKETER